MFNKIKIKFQPNNFILLSWWIISTYTLTIIFKWKYLNSAFRAQGGFSSIIKEFVDKPNGIEKFISYFFYFSKDFFDVFLIISILYISAHLLMKVKLKIIIFTASILTILIFLGNSLSFSELQSLMSVDTILISLNWVKDNPSLISDFVSKKMILMIVIGSLLYASIPLIILKLSIKFKIVKNINTKISKLILILTICSLIIYSSLNFVFDKSLPLPFQGYWGNTLSSLLIQKGENPLKLTIPSKKELIQNYNSLVFPQGKGEKEELIAQIVSSNRKPRHILIFRLETAPNKYYPICNNSSLPHFYKMSKNSITSSNHHTNIPYTNNANYSIISGTYSIPIGSGTPVIYGNFTTDGIGNTLKESGYKNTYIDTYQIDWNGGNRNKSTLENLGFDKTIELWNESDTKQNLERNAIEYAISELDTAIKNNQHALLFINSNLGHYKWPAPINNDTMNNVNRMKYLNRFFDNLIGSFVDSLSVRNLLDDIIITIVGDHGFRYKNEFASLGEEMKPSDIEFNVAFMIYSPGLFKENIKLPYITSHIDIAPTLIYLVGKDNNTFLHHGMNMLDRRIKERVSFMLNTGLSPIDGYVWENNYFTFNRLLEKSQISNRADRKDIREINVEILEKKGNIPKRILNPEKVIAEGNNLSLLTAGYFLKNNKGNSTTK